MKNKFITQVQTRMASILNPMQLEELGRVLMDALHHIDIMKKTELSLPSIDNSDLQKVFIGAKRIEGCSEKSLKYYDSTLQAMLASVKRLIREITTDDLRNYLADYQEKRNSGKVTIDNMRRIFPVFLAGLRMKITF